MGDRGKWRPLADCRARRALRRRRPPWPEQDGEQKNRDVIHGWPRGGSTTRTIAATLQRRNVCLRAIFHLGLVTRVLFSSPSDERIQPTTLVFATLQPLRGAPVEPVILGLPAKVCSLIPRLRGVSIFWPASLARHDLLLREPALPLLRAGGLPIKWPRSWRSGQRASRVLRSIGNPQDNPSWAGTLGAQSGHSRIARFLFRFHRSHRAYSPLSPARCRYC
jgi:hypothetical protein